MRGRLEPRIRVAGFLSLLALGNHQRFVPGLLGTPASGERLVWVLPVLCHRVPALEVDIHAPTVLFCEREQELGARSACSLEPA